MKLARTVRAAALSLLVSIGTLATITSMAIGVQSCAWFDKHVEPVVKPIAVCAGQSVSAADFQEAVNDLTTKNYVDLGEMGVRLGWDVVACIVDNIGAQNPSLKPAGEEFKAKNAEKIRRAQAPSTALRSPGDSAPRSGPTVYQKESPAGGAPRVPAGRAFAYAGESVDHARQSCEARCGSLDAVGSPGGSCLCQRRVDGVLRWVAAR